MSQYSDRVLEHFYHPRGVGRLEPYDGIGTLGDPDCGDFLEVTIRLSEDHERLTAVAFRVKGCPAAIATSSMMTELSTNATVEQSLALTDQQIIDALDGLPPGKEHCSLLAVRGLQLAVQDALLRRLLKKAGMVTTDEEFDQLKASGGLEHFFHRCDGSCEALAEPSDHQKGNE